jgi:hypothetical protein
MSERENLVQCLGWALDVIKILDPKNEYIIARNRAAKILAYAETCQPEAGQLCDGLEPVDPALLQPFKDAMQNKTIPAIVDAVRARQKAAAEYGLPKAPSQSEQSDAIAQREKTPADYAFKRLCRALGNPTVECDARGDITASVLDLAADRIEQGDSLPSTEEISAQWCKELIAALKRLSFAAQTTGGKAGRDEELCAAIAQAEEAMSLRATNRALNAAEQGEAEPFAKWYLGTQNDILYIIDGPPCAGNDQPIHEHGPDILLRVPAGREADEFTKQVVELHNKSLTRPAPRAAVPDEFLSGAVLDNVKAVIRHWNEFGPDHGFNERMDRLYEAFEAAPEQGGV